MSCNKPLKKTFKKNILEITETVCGANVERGIYSVQSQMINIQCLDICINELC